ncbi:phosphatase PAP2 family protein [Subtercola endophyticus]|uniref:phosphatase PAP2 family protein n=1 Tax=Subtercola endophyticus TaxID=2895559 RepID=UPI001E4633BA|nr:phosphatase PAP2 family protein [Subtercola endophyticus]UFS57884.1 phosphatase PAP2 family protein [Subtercola endophyticus]
MTTLRASETSFIVAVQGTRVARTLVPAGKALSFFGEHAAGWILLGLLGAGIDWSHAGAWLLSVLAVIVAHGLSVVIKRVVRRPRPGATVGADGKFDAGKGGYPVTAGGRVDARGSAETGEQRASGAVASAVKVYASAPSKLSFPSSHASSTMAACIVYTAFFPWLWPVAVVVALAMGFSRVILGMHFVTDVLAGYAIGLIVGVPTILLLHG